MRDQGVTTRALTVQLGLSDTTVGRLADLDRRWRIGLVSNALRAVGPGLVIEGRASPGFGPSTVSRPVPDSGEQTGRERSKTAVRGAWCTFRNYANRKYRFRFSWKTQEYP